MEPDVHKRDLVRDRELRHALPASVEAADGSLLQREPTDAQEEERIGRERQPANVRRRSGMPALPS